MITATSQEDDDPQQTISLITGQDDEWLSLDEATEQITAAYIEGTLSDEDARALIGMPSL